MTLSREDAWALVTEYTQSESLRKHMLAVAAAVRGYARLWGENEEDWGVVALLHDFDYERWPDQQNHPFRGVEILKEKGYPEWVTRAILSHADYSGVPRESRLEKTLYACDEMSGFVTAAALVRPSKSVLDLEAASVLKRMKDKAFARAVNREDLQARRRGARPAARGARRQRHQLSAARGRTARAQGKPLTRESRITKDLETAATLPPIATPAPDPAAPVVQLDGVTVIYGKNQALKNVTARFARGAVGLLGPNGAGKSTMLKSLLGFVKPDHGKMSVLGLDVAERPLEIRSRIGYMPENDAHIPGMTAVSFVAYCGELAGLPAVDAMQRAHEVLYYVGLGEARYRNIETYSTGMKQRIKLAQALVHDPDLLFLDEPTNGMDPKGRDEMLELVRDLGHNKNVSLILSSHLLPDVEYTCDHVIVMDKGQIAAQGPIEELKGPAGRVFELRIKGNLPAFIDVLRSAGMECHSTEADVMRVFVPHGTDGVERDQRAIFALAARHGVQVRHLRPSIPTLEDVFAKALGEE